VISRRSDFAIGFAPSNRITHQRVAAANSPERCSPFPDLAMAVLSFVIGSTATRRRFLALRAATDLPLRRLFRRGRGRGVSADRAVSRHLALRSLPDLFNITARDADRADLPAVMSS